MTASVDWDIDLGEAAGHCHRDRNGNLVQPIPDEPPSPFAEHYDRDPSASQILLVANIAIGGDEDSEASRFGRVQQFAIPQRVPAPRARLLDDVA